MILLLILVTTGACARIKTFNALNDFEKSSKRYNQMLRWHELNMAGSTFADDSVKEEYTDRARAAKGVTITDYRVLSQECSPEKKTARAVVEIDYYIPPSVTLKTVEDVQKWEYVDINEKKFWRLKTLLPEFK
jgi:hypothetical protein